VFGGEFCNLVRRENKIEIFCHKFLVLKKKLPKNSRVCFCGENVATF
jgi:hypothetical protein